MKREVDRNKFCACRAINATRRGEHRLMATHIDSIKHDDEEEERGKTKKVKKLKI